MNLERYITTWIASLIGIGGLGWLHQHLLAPNDMVMIIGSFGATAVLVYGAYDSPLAQPRNVIGGHFLSAFVGVACAQALPWPFWFQAGVAVATAIVLMMGTKTTHPPGGATALIAVIGSEKIKVLGFGYAFVPVLSGAIIMVLVALAAAKLSPERRYPKWWW